MGFRLPYLSSGNDLAYRQQPLPMQNEREADHHAASPYSACMGCLDSSVISR